MTMTKFFVYASGRWCEVDATDGSVSGWRRKARFVYCRRGRLEVARSRDVLSGLQALQAGTPTTVRDGPRLSQLRCVNKESNVRRPRRQLTDTPAHCCTHAHMHAHTCNNNTDCNAPKPLRKPQSHSENHVKVDASTQMQPVVLVSPLKQSLAAKDQESSLDETFEVTKLKAGSKLRLSKIKTQQTKSKKKDIVNTDSSVQTTNFKRRHENKNGESTEIVQQKKKIKLLPVMRPGPAKRKRSESSSSDAITKPEARNQSAKNSSTKLQPATSKRKVSVRSSSDSDFEITKPETRNRSPKKSPSKLKPATSQRKVSVTSTSDTDIKITKVETRNSTSKKRLSKLKSTTSKRGVSDTSSSNSDVEMTMPKTRNSTSKKRLSKLKSTTSKRGVSETSSSNSDVEMTMPKTRNTTSKKSPSKLKPTTSKRGVSVGSNSDSDFEITEPDKTPSKLKPTKKKVCVSLIISSDSDVKITSPVKSDATKINKPDSRNRKVRLEHKSTRRESSSFDSDSTVKISKLEPENKSAKIYPVKQKSRTLNRGNLESVLLSKLTNRIHNHSDSSSSNEISTREQIQMSNWLVENKKRRQDEQRILFKELIIDESDVEVMRQFLIKYAMDIDIEAFDRDDEYKRMVFYRINPLVNLERNPIIAAMCRREAQEDMTLQDFMSNLGLRSITDSHQTSSQYKTRSKVRVSKKQKTRRSSNDTDKENVKKPSDNKEIRKDCVKNGRIQKAAPRRLLNNRARDREGNKTSTVRSDSDRERDGTNVSKLSSNEQVSKNLPAGTTAKIKHSISKRPISRPRREYSNLEDHAIVSWVSMGGRACKVNGNQVWRDLQPQFTKIGDGTGRSWHSLRNRYLRYILPSLPRLHLPQEQVARLRAGAATGAIKSRNRPQRRNSIFDKEEGVKGAWSRRPRTPPKQHVQESDTEHSPPRRALRSSVRPSPAPGTPDAEPPPPPQPRTPRYSDLTRLFSSRHPVLRGSESPLPAPPSPPLQPRGNRKKLFNPNTIQ